MYRRLRALVVLAPLVMLGCSLEVSTIPGDGGIDAAAGDAGRLVDGGTVDGGTDAGRVDAGNLEPDAGACTEASCEPGFVCVGSTCQPSSCGDGITDAATGEECDDGNTDPLDGCEPETCVLSCHDAAECQDGDVCNGAELCSAAHVCEASAPAPNGTACELASGAGMCRSALCVTPECGDGVVFGTEHCDDGNDTAGDGCESDCRFSCETDPTVTHTWYADCDGDDFASPAGATSTECLEPAPSLCGGGWTLRAPDGSASDCNDHEATIHAGATEICNLVDEDCNGIQDDGVRTIFYVDADGDGFGSPGATTEACVVPAGHATRSDDCDDTCAACHPGGTEICDRADDDCDGSTDEDVTTTFFRDADGDGEGAADMTVEACTAPSGFAATSTDCNDACATCGAGGTEVCDGLDNDCDATVDDGVLITFYFDFDGDGFGASAPTTRACVAPDGFAASSTDCNDGSASIRPGAPEVCNGLDDDCNGVADEGVRTTYFRDADGDGFGTPFVTTQACTSPAGYVVNGTDCDDTRASVRPGATELCNGVDENCSGTVDEGNPGGGGVCSTGLLGRCGAGVTVCSAGAITCATTTSSMPEICNGLDDSCDGVVDEGNPGAGAGCTTGRPGVCAAGTTTCSSGALSCIQTAAASAEVCNGQDDDCNGTIDNGVSTRYYRDADGDGFGNSALSTDACAQPPGYVLIGTDCNDINSAIRPGAVEICGNGVDDNCDGSTC